MKFIFLPLLVFLQSGDLRSQADDLFINQQWEELVPVLDELIEDNPSAELFYDKGVALYELESYVQAKDAFDEAMNHADDNELRAYSAFNYGNSLFNETMQGLEGTSEVSNESLKAIEDAKSHIKQSINHYRDVIQQDSSDYDARANGEIAWHMLKQLEQMQEQMEQQQQEQQEDANNQEQEQEEQESSGQEQEQQDGRDNQEQDEQESEQGEQQDQSNQDGEQQDSGPEESDQPSEEQNESSDQGDKEDLQDSEQQDSSEGDSTQEEQSEANENDSESSQQEEPMQDGELETAEQESELQEGEEQEGQVKKAGNRLSKDETNRLLQLIRDKEKERRQAIAARKAKNRKPVTKDW